MKEEPARADGLIEPETIGGAEVQGELLERLAEQRERIRRYTIRDEVARGGMGAILRAWDEDLRRNLAMKVMLVPTGEESQDASASGDPRMIARFLNEAQVNGQLEHPGIVPVHEIGLDSQSHLYFTMRLVKGRDLKEIYDLVFAGREDWSTTRALYVLLKVCEAMAYAHEKGVVHRDLKPANVMVGRFGEVYVMDWGLARVLGRRDVNDLRLKPELPPMLTVVESDLADVRRKAPDSPIVTMDGDVVGTPCYMAPEQARGEVDRLGPRSDVYSLGAMLYHLLAREMPYMPAGEEVGIFTVLTRLRDAPPRPLAEIRSDVPAELLAITDKAMARDPADRYPDMQALGEDLRAFLENRVVSAYATGAFVQVKKWVKRNKALSATIASAVVILLAGLVTHSLVLSKKNDELAAANERSTSSEKLALTNEALAKSQAAIAQERAAKILRLSDIKRLEQLGQSADSLWPADPDHVSRYEAWLGDARTLFSRLPEHRSALAEIRTRARPPVPLPASDSTAAPAGDRPRSWEFESTEDRWQHDTQDELVRGLERFADPTQGLIVDVERRLAFARTVEDLTVSGARAHDLWVVAIASIADVRACPAYAGLRITPQLGLYPIGRDPHSGLWEFAHLQTGEIPRRDEGTDEIVLTPDSSVVFVLLPGGAFTMGAQNEDKKGPNYDPQSLPEESPARRLTLDPFFMSKYEMTQGQWERFTGKNPSVYGPGNLFGDDANSRLHPVEHVSWTECFDVLGRLGLELPTEAQWEYAERAGTRTSWWTGDDKESLDGAVNLADQSASEIGANWPSLQDWPELNDGWPVHAPVNTFRANPFGLHNMPGNVWEWCRDAYEYYQAEVRPGDGESSAPKSTNRVSRGGSFVHEAAWVRSARRNKTPPDIGANHLGLRPARALTK